MTTCDITTTCYIACMPRQPKRVSERIRAAIAASEASRYRIAKDCEIAESTLSRFMAGEQGLSMQAIDTLAEYFGMELVQKRKRGQA